MSSATPRPPAPTIHDTGSFTGAPPAYVDSARLEANDLAARVTLVAVVRVAMVTAVLALLIVFNWLNPPDRVADVETWQYVLIATVYAASVVYGGLLRVRRLLRPLVHAQAVLDAVVRHLQRHYYMCITNQQEEIGARVDARRCPRGNRPAGLLC